MRRCRGCAGRRPTARAGKKGGDKIYNLTAIKGRFRDALADSKAVTTAEAEARAAEKVTLREAKEAKAATHAAMVQQRKGEQAVRAAEEHVRATEETSVRAAGLWAHGEEREQRQVAAARDRSYAGDDDSEGEEDSEADVSEAESSEDEAEGEAAGEGEADEDEEDEEEGWYGESLNEAAAVAAEQQQERQQEEAAARLAEADQEAAEREARTLTAKEEIALRKLIRTKTNQLEAQLCNDVSEDSPLAVALLDQITEAKEQLHGAGVKLTSPPAPKKKRTRE